MYGEQLRHSAEALLDDRVEVAVAVVRAKDPATKAGYWRRLDELDRALDDMLLDLDPEWSVTEYIRDRWSPANVPYSPAEWTEPAEPPDDQRRTSRDW
jgi:hypothetical protein